MNTGAYGRSASCMPLEGAGRNLIPASSTNLPLWTLFSDVAAAQALRGLQPNSGKLTFHYLPPQLEGTEKTSAQQIRALQVRPHRYLPDIPDGWGVYATHSKNRWETAQPRRLAQQGEASMQTDQCSQIWQRLIEQWAPETLQ